MKRPVEPRSFHPPPLHVTLMRERCEEREDAEKDEYRESHPFIYDEETGESSGFFY